MRNLRSPLQRNPDYRKLFVAQGVSYAGDWFATVALIGRTRDLRRGSEVVDADPLGVSR